MPGGDEWDDLLDVVGQVERTRQAYQLLAEILQPAPRSAAVEAERVLAKEAAQARADEFEVCGCVIMPPPPGREDDPDLTVDEQFADPVVRRYFQLDDPNPDWSRS